MTHVINSEPGIDTIMQSLERLSWSEYAVGRMASGSVREIAARRNFEDRIETIWEKFFQQARRRGKRLDFTAVRLRLLAIEALDKPCTYCGEMFGLGCFGVVWDIPARPGWPGFTLANVTVPCIACANGKGSLSGDEWRDVVAALRGADPAAARDTLLALASGRKECSARRG